MPLWVLLVNFCIETDIYFQCYEHTFAYTSEINCTISKSTAFAQIKTAVSTHPDGALLFSYKIECINTRDVKV